MGRNKFQQIKNILISLLVWFLGINCSNAQQLNYKPIPAAYLKLNSNIDSFKYASDKIKTNGYDLLKSLPANLDKTGKVDYTAQIQKAIDTYRIVIFPPFPLLINSVGIRINSNSTILFMPGSKLILKSNDLPKYKILSLQNVENVTLYYPVVVGDRTTHFGSVGEWGIGIFLGGAKNIKLVRPHITNCWGDGIYLGAGNETNENIIIYNAFLDNNRRNGISVITAEKLSIVNALIANTNGTMPMSGIDFEPNNSTQKLKNISIINPITFNNGSRGIIFALRKLYGETEKEIDIAIENHLDDGSNYGIGLGISMAKPNPNLAPIKGNITFKNPTWKNSRSAPIQYYRVTGNKIKVYLQNVQNLKQDVKNTEMLNSIKKRYKEEKEIIFQN